MHLPPSRSKRGPLRPPLKPKPKPTLDDLLKGTTKEQFGGEYDWGKPVGEEFGAAKEIMDRRRTPLRELALQRHRART